MERGWHAYLRDSRGAGRSDWKDDSREKTGISIAQATAAVRLGLDYISVGPHLCHHTNKEVNAPVVWNKLNM